MTNIAQRLLQNTKQHARAHAIEIEQARQARLMIDVARHTEQRHIMCAEDQL
jgi:hypothetical protein